MDNRHIILFFLISQAYNFQAVDLNKKTDSLASTQITNEIPSNPPKTFSKNFVFMTSNASQIAQAVDLLYYRQSQLPTTPDTKYHYLPIVRIFMHAITPTYGEKKDVADGKNIIPANHVITCSLEPKLAGNLDPKICDAIHHLMVSRIRPTVFQNAILFYGPPGTGKTTIAKEIAKNAGAEFLSYSASSMITKWQGSGSEGIRNIFTAAQKFLDDGKTVVIFIDEIDAIARERGSGRTHIDHDNALNQFLVQVSDYKDNSRLLIIVATNMIDLLDSAVRSRFLEIEIATPDEKMCRELFSHYLKNYAHNLQNIIPVLAQQATQAQLSCRDIENVVKLAYSVSQRMGSSHILEDAIWTELAQKTKARLREKEHQRQLLEDVHTQRELNRKNLQLVQKEEEMKNLNIELLKLQIQWYRDELKKGILKNDHQEKPSSLMSNQDGSDYERASNVF